MKVSDNEILAAADIIRKGGLVAFPTETVYGLGANALDANAVARIFAIKERPSFDPLIVHIASVDTVAHLMLGFDERVNLLARAFWPGPLTIVVPKNNSIPDIVTAGLPNVGLRMPANDVALRLIEAAGCPVAAPSANKFGQLSPTQAGHVRKAFPALKHVLDGGPCRVGVESTVVALDARGFLILRPGAITREMLQKHVPASPATGVSVLEAASPGHMPSHYSPTKPLFIEGIHQLPADTSGAAYLSADGRIPQGYAHVEILSAKGSLNEVAVNLFGALHRMEEAEVEFIVAQTVEPRGIGLAIMDRLRKAAHRFHKD
ncbi:MAG: threonylcarbamoyl-AMP synthase [Bacteroidetes bacterium]|nr:threonylcarbamoyl-AMP synthase [Bacteroidota bacterium]